jgi:uncharacterized protein
VAVAGAALAAAFTGPPASFWNRMTGIGAALTAIALVASPEARGTRIRPRDLVVGAWSAAVLSLVFAAGDRIVRRVIPGGDRMVDRLIALGTLEPPGAVAMRLVGVIAPAEELFWRGWVQETLAARYGRWRGAVLATILYAAAHAGAGNIVLVGAAGFAGAHWSSLRAAGVPLGALLVSHAAWDVWIFLVRPTGATRMEWKTSRPESR